MASALSNASGKSVAYEPVSSEELREALEAKGLRAPEVALSVSIGDAMRDGEFDAGSPELERLMSRDRWPSCRFCKRLWRRSEGRAGRSAADPVARSPWAARWSLSGLTPAFSIAQVGSQKGGTLRRGPLKLLESTTDNG